MTHGNTKLKFLDHGLVTTLTAPYWLECLSFSFCNKAGCKIEDTFKMTLHNGRPFKYPHMLHISGITRNFCSGGVQKIQLRTEDKENGDLGTVAP